MPCSDSPGYRGYSLPEEERKYFHNSGYNEAKNYYEYALKDIRKRNDLLARIACKAIRELEILDPNSLLFKYDEEVCEWWEDHKKFDTERKKLKKTIKAGLNKIKKRLV